MPTMPHRYALALLALLLAGISRAAPVAPEPVASDAIAALASPVRIDVTADDDFADLAPFGAAVGSARIVALDEQTHGGHEEFALKTRLLRYLHERLGFDVLVLESGFFDVGQLQEAMQGGARVDDLAPGNIFFMYSKSAEGRRLLQYIDATRGTAHPLVLAGMDSQHSGLLSQRELLPRLSAFLASHGSGVPASPEWAGFAATVAAMTALRQEPPPAAERAAFDQASAQIARELAGLRQESPAAIGSAGWWGRVVADLPAQAQSLWVAPRGNARDQAMGDNVVWIAEHQAPGRRVVVWGHAIHLMHDVPDAAAPPFAGTVVRRRFGADYHVAHLTGLAGRYLDYTTLQPHDIPATPAASLEARLGRRPGAALFLPPPAAPAADAPAARYIDYQLFGPLPGRGLHWESTFFIRQLTPVAMVR
jgi:erythromycin esterase